MVDVRRILLGLLRSDLHFKGAAESCRRDGPTREVREGTSTLNDVDDGVNGREQKPYSAQT